MTTNKRKMDKVQAQEQAQVQDSRFTFAAEDLDRDEDEDGSNKQQAGEEADDQEDDDEEEQGDALAGPSLLPTASNPLPAHLLPSKGRSHTTPGLIYLSRIPPGMGPSKAKHLLSAFGEVGRVFLARSDPDPPQNLSSHKRQKDKHREHRFAEGWIEFMDKRVARTVAEMLNANPIGGKKGSRWRDDVWTMKYLPRFRWDMLSEQVALERATQTSLLRFHLQHSRTEQESYLSAVEKARVNTAIELKAEGRREGKRLKTAGSATDPTIAQSDKKEEKKKGRERTYRQREVLEAGGEKRGSQADLDGVLSRLF